MVDGIRKLDNRPKKPVQYPGMLITFEGPDGSGKTTQVNMLAEALRQEGYDVVTTKMPGHTALGADIRKHLFTTTTTHKMPVAAIDMCFLVDHIMTLHEVVLPGLRCGCIVISDRYADSNLAYMRERRSPRICFDAVRALYGPTPNTTILLTGDTRVLLERAMKRNTEAGKQVAKTWANPEAQDKIQMAYRFNLDKQAHVFNVQLDQSMSQEDVFLKYISHVLGQVNQHRGLRKAS